jgi:hypothetical protein
MLGSAAVAVAHADLCSQLQVSLPAMLLSGRLPLSSKRTAATFTVMAS